jgi:hypothetical protein
MVQSHAALGGLHEALLACLQMSGLPSTSHNARGIDADCIYIFQEDIGDMDVE